MKSSILAFDSIDFGCYVYISTDSIYEVTQAKYIDTEMKSDESYKTNDSFSSYKSSSSSSSSDSIEYTIERRNSEDIKMTKKYFNEYAFLLLISFTQLFH